MQFLLDNWVLITVSSGSLFLLMLPEITKSQKSGLSPGALVQLMNRGKPILLDIRPASNFAKQHIKGAKNIEPNAFAQQLPVQIKNKKVPLILVCDRGIRAKKAVAQVIALGFDDVQVLGGGMGAWQNANLPTQSVD